jgi:restriction system protein
MNLVALMPWWAGVAIAVISYLVLHRMAAPVQTNALQGGQISHHMSQAIITGLATAGQYIVPIVCLLGAVISFIRRKKRTELIADVAESKNINAFDGMTWREFEILVGEAYRLQGFSVAETGGGGADGGVDLVLTKGGEKYFVQCKQWKAYKVGVDVVRELYGVMAAKGAAGGFVVTSGRFTDDAKAFADGRNMVLVDGTKLFSMIKQVKQSQPARLMLPPKNVLHS